MQEDIENKSLTLIINTSKLTARTLATAFMKFLRYSKNKVREHQNVKPQGKQSMKQLIAQNQGVENTELADRNEAKSFDRYARQYGVDYAIQKGFSQDGKVLMRLWNFSFCHCTLMVWNRFVCRTPVRDRQPSSAS